jgi:hypothetical protein
VLRLLLSSVVGRLFSVFNILFWLGGARPLPAQRLTLSYLNGAHAATDTVTHTPPPVADPAGMALAGVATGAVAMVAGGHIGYALGGGSRVCGDDPCGFEEAIYGAAVGISLGIPLGVHLANRSRGSFGTEVATSLAIGALGMTLALGANNGVVLLAVPVAQLAASIAIERHTGMASSP